MSFGKSIAMFLIAFLLGLFVVNLFNSERLPELKLETTFSFAEKKQRNCDSFDSFELKKYRNFNVEELKKEIHKIITSADKIDGLRIGRKEDLTPKEWEISQRKQKVLNRKLDTLFYFMAFKEGRLQRNLSYLKNCYER